MSVIPGLLLTKEGAQGGCLFMPFFWSIWALFTHHPEPLAFLLLPSHIVLVRQGARGNHAALSACTLLEPGVYLCLWGLAPLQLTNSRGQWGLTELW